METEQNTKQARGDQLVELRSAPGRTSRCRHCNEPVQWAITRRGASIPVDIGARIEQGSDALFVSSADVHFATCRRQDLVKRAQERRASIPEAEQRLQRRIDLLTAELATSCPRSAVDNERRQVRELLDLLRWATAKLLEPGAKCADVAEAIEAALARRDCKGREPYPAGRRLAGD